MYLGRSVHYFKGARKHRPPGGPPILKGIEHRSQNTKNKIKSWQATCIHINYVLRNVRLFRLN